ncbi:MAG: hypothetical protein U1F43_13485 [Myxococcota bacterium]
MSALREALARTWAGSAEVAMIERSTAPFVVARRASRWPPDAAAPEAEAAPAPAARLVIDRARAAALGVSADEIARALALCGDGATPARMRVRDSELPVRVRVVADGGDALAGVLAATVRGGDGQLVPLSMLATLER